MLESKVCTLKGDDIFIREKNLLDLADEHDYVEVFHFQAFGYFPEPPRKRMFNALLVSVIDHGLTPSATSARLTLYGAPDAMQGALAAGLLGAGSRLIGAISAVAEMLQSGVGDQIDLDDEKIQEIATAIVTRFGERKQRIPGIGHMIHANGDPRSERMFNIARQTGFFGSHCRLSIAVAEAASKRARRFLPLNAPGAKAGIMLDMGLTPEACRAINLLGRTGGLLSHILEEVEHPIAPEIWKLIRQEAERSD